MLYILSDLHIESESDPLYTDLIRFVCGLDREDVVVFAGDVFDVFLGNKRLFKDRYQTFIAELRSQASLGIQFHYIEGNHDFYLYDTFPSVPGIKIHVREAVIEIAGKRILIAHGDLVDRTDVSYLALRAAFRSPIIKRLFWVLPDTWVDAFGKRSSRMSRTIKDKSDGFCYGLDGLRKKYRNYAIDQMKQGYDFVVLGHCHDLDEISVKIGDRQCQYINVGYPRIHRSILAIGPGDSKIARTAF